MKWLKKLNPYVILGVAGLLVGILLCDIFLSDSAKPGVVWTPYSEAAFKTALDEKKPVMIYFSADWCGPCQVLHQKTFTDQDVMDDAGRFVRFKVDLTKPEGEAAKTQEKFSVIGFPTVVFIGKDGEERTKLRLLGFEEAARFRKRMAAVQ